MVVGGDEVVSVAVGVEVEGLGAAELLDGLEDEWVGVGGGVGAVVGLFGHLA